jgi:hypothetical protein
VLRLAESKHPPIGLLFGNIGGGLLAKVKLGIARFMSPQILR